jgi:hypothetical protein
MRSTIALVVIGLALLAGPAHAATNEQVIRAVFGQYGSQAVAVARCESGLSTWAHNGQYLGAFQMGSYARSRYGHGNDIWTQARAAYAYFRDSGYRWGPWSCKPY